MSAVGVAEARPADRRVGGGSRPTTALHDLRVAPLPLRAAKGPLVRNHYLHSVPGGTLMAFGVFVAARLLGAPTLGVGPNNGHRLIEGAVPADVITPSRLCLADELSPNSASRARGERMRTRGIHRDQSSRRWSMLRPRR